MAHESSRPGSGPGVAASLLDAIGRTPLIRLNRLAAGVPAQVLVKLESLNPGGSIKDRVGVAMVDEAERRGWLRPGGTIIEATAGNTGVGLALAAAVKGYRCIFVLPDKMSGEKIRLLKAYGAEIVITPTSVPPDSPESYNGVADRLAREIPGAWRPNQFANLANPEVHYRTTGPEIWEQTGGQGHRVRRGRRHRRHDLGRGPLPEGAEPRDPDHRRRPGGLGPLGRLAPGPGRSRGSARTSSPRRSTARSSTSGSASATPRASTRPAALARREGLLVGGSSGTAVAAALRYARRLTADDVVVALCPDTGRNYLSKFYDDAWLAENELLHAEPPTETDRRPAAARGPRELVTVAPDATAAEAVELMQARGISQLPVLRDGQSVGSIQEVTLARLLHDERRPARRSASATSWPGRCPSSTSASTSTRRIACCWRATRACWRSPASAVVDIVTRIDLIQYWSRRRGDADRSPTEGDLITMPSEHPDHGFSTRAIHAGQEADPATGATVVPIYATSTFTQEAPGRAQGLRVLAERQPDAHRAGNLPGGARRGRAGLAFASGLAATTAVLSTLRPGDEVAAAADLYGGTFRLLERVFKPWGLVAALHRGRQPRRASPRSSRPTTKLVWIETPTNPLLQIIDIAAIAELAHEHGALLAVDNTFASPYLQRPIELGADLVVHSTTKYLGGHSDVIGGAVIGRRDLLEPIAFYQNAAGGVPGPFDAWLVLRGHQDAGRPDGAALRQCPGARRVAGDAAAGRAGLLSRACRIIPNHDVAAPPDARLRRHDQHPAQGRRARPRCGSCARTRLFSLAESLGGVESLIGHPATMTHASIPAEVRAARGVDDGLVRLSVGIEDVEDLREDLRRALA